MAVDGAGGRVDTLPGRAGMWCKFVKISDDYHAKIRLWAARPVVVPLPRGPVFPRFKVQRFRNHAEMNLWKAEFLRQIARQAADELNPPAGPEGRSSRMGWAGSPGVA